MAGNLVKFTTEILNWMNGLCFHIARYCAVMLELSAIDGCYSCIRKHRARLFHWLSDRTKMLVNILSRRVYGIYEVNQLQTYYHHMSKTRFQNTCLQVSINRYETRFIPCQRGGNQVFLGSKNGPCSACEREVSKDRTLWKYFAWLQRKRWWGKETELLLRGCGYGDSCG